MNQPGRPFADPRHCPWCGAPLTGPVCRACGLQLHGELGQRLWHASTQVDHWLGERQRLLQQIRRLPAPQQQPAVRPAPQTPPQHQPAPRTALQPQPAAAPARHRPQPTPPPAPQPARRGLGMQTLLVGVGALLLAVAAIVFLAFSWDLLGLTGRSLVVATLTLAVLGGALLARRARLGATAEAVAAFGVVLVLLDAVAVRATGLAGTGMGRLAYAAVAMAVCGLLLGGYGLLGRLRAASISASLLLPLAPVLAGLHLALRSTDSVTDAARAATAVGLGLVAGSAVGLLRALPNRLVPPTERTILTAAGATLLVAAAPLPIVAAATGDAMLGAVLALAVAAGAAAHGLARPDGAHTAWLGAAGVSLAMAACLAVLDLTPGRWSPLSLPLATGAVALTLGVLGRAPAGLVPISLGRSGHGAFAVLAVTALPAATIGIGQALFAFAAGMRPWSAETGTPITLAAGLGPDYEAVSDTVRYAGLAGLVVIAAVLVGRWWIDRVAAWPVIATLAAGLALVALPWQPGAPLLLAVAASVVVAIGVTAGAVAFERWSGRRGLRSAGLVTAALVVASVALVDAVVAAWAAKWLSVPVTLLGVLALLAGRRRRPAIGALLLPTAALSLLVCVGAVGRWLGLSAMDGALVACAAGALAVVVALVVPQLAMAERRSLLLTGALPLAAAAIATFRAGFVVDGTRETVTGLVQPRTVGVLAAEALGTAPRPQLLLAVTLLTALLVAVWPGRRLAGHPLAGDALVATGVATAAAAALAASSASAVWAAAGIGPGRDAPLAAAAVCVVAAVAATSLARLRDGRRTPLEVVAAGVAVLVLAAVVVDSSAATAWPVLLVLAAAAAVEATAPDRRWAGWVALVLGTAALWTRLLDDRVTVVEAYTLPPAAALLAVAALAWRRGGQATTPTAIGGVALAVLPTAVAGVTGAPWRAVAVLVVAAGLVAAAHLASGAATRHATPAGTGSGTDERMLGLGRVALATAVVATVAGPWLRSLAISVAGPSTEIGVVTYPVPEPWSVPAALLLAAAAVPASRLVAHPATTQGRAIPAIAALAVPSLLVGDHDAAGLVRALALLAVLGSVSVVASHMRQPTTAYAALGAAAVTSLTALARDVAGPVELVTVPLAAAVLGVGLVEMRRQPRLGSWPWIGTGSALLLAPSLLASFAEAPAARVAGLALAATGVLVAGSVLRWQAPLLVGAAVLVVHAIVQLAPWVALAYAAVPRWVSLGLAGALLLALGARYERRLRDVQMIRLRVGSMR